MGDDITQWVFEIEAHDSECEAGPVFEFCGCQLRGFLRQARPRNGSGVHEGYASFGCVNPSCSTRGKPLELRVAKPKVYPEYKSRAWQVDDIAQRIYEWSEAHDDQCEVSPVAEFCGCRLRVTIRAALILCQERFCAGSRLLLQQALGEVAEEDRQYLAEHWEKAAELLGRAKNA